MKRLLLTGGSGYIGGEILAQFNDPGNDDIKSNLEVFAVYRKDAHKDKLLALGAKPVRLDISDLPAVKKFIVEEKIDIVIELTEAFKNELQLACLEALKSRSGSGTLITTGGAKFFASFSAIDTSKVIYDDESPLDSTPKQDRIWPTSENAQKNLKVLLAAGQAAGLSTHIVIPPIVYGQSRTFGNPISIQNVKVCKALLKYGKPIIMPPTDPLPQTYAISHVEDTSSMYIALLRRALTNNHADSGFYFAENGVLEWDKLALRFAEGLNLSNEVTVASPEMIRDLQEVFGGDETWVRISMGGRTNICGRAGKKIGWEPKYDVQHMYAVASEEAKHIYRNGLARGIPLSELVLNLPIGLPSERCRPAEIRWHLLPAEINTYQTMLWLDFTTTLLRFVGFLGPHWHFPPEVDLLSASVQDLQGFLSNGTITSVQLTRKYLENIAAHNHAGLELRAVIETAPYQSVMQIAQELDDLRASGTVLSELHGIPMLFKDNIATDGSLLMNTTAGSFGFLGDPLPPDSPVSAKLRAKGVIIIGKANLSELAYYKGNITSGWSARGGQTQSAYVVGGFPAGGNPCGSSSGSAVGVSAGFAAASLGSETHGSLVCPASRAALYTIRMTVGLSSRTGVIPISSTQDTVGPMAKTTYDCALILENMVGHDPLDPYTESAINHTLSNYTQFTAPPYATFKGKVLAIPRDVFYNATLSELAPEMIETLNTAIAKMRSVGATIIDPANVPSAEELITSTTETTVLDTDFKVDLAEYLAWAKSSKIRSLEDLINFNDANADVEFAPGQCCQEVLIRAVQTTGKDTTIYKHARAQDYDIGRTRGIDAVLDHYDADALVLPAEGHAAGLAAVAGYPIVSVPLGYLPNGRPYGMAFIGRQWSEPLLISLMAAWEANSPPRRIPPQLQA